MKSSMFADFESFEQFLELEQADRGQFFFTDQGKIDNVIFAQQFSRKFLEYIFKLAWVIRYRISTDNSQTNWLHRKFAQYCALMLFAQSSTRTRLSHEAACHIVGLRFSHVDNMKLSSESKKESPLDTFLNCAMLYDVVVMRHPDADFVERCAWTAKMFLDENIHVINGGSRLDQHPTQALLDYMTMHVQLKNVGGLDGKTIMFAGDMTGRTVRSNAYLARCYPDITLIFCAPESNQVEPDITTFLDKHGIKYKVTQDFDESVRVADVVYMTRTQNDADYGRGENSNGCSLQSDLIELLKKHGIELPNQAGLNDALLDVVQVERSTQFDFQNRHVQMLKHSTIVMHPGPRNEELFAIHNCDPRIQVLPQVGWGKYIRAALYTIFFGVDDDIKVRFKRDFM